ncbi:3921_t:CDS:2 [Cetraspora pellucida]|uniref:3921_t:CDS:1 n=1 Tax=Cetraspora pellucida TaxID=1433469 RepID=A0A9N9EVZ0_9GLOM|nr:3921_t:CDS:2 [Cetraspora pellucida]
MSISDVGLKQELVVRLVNKYKRKEKLSGELFAKKKTVNIENKMEDIELFLNAHNDGFLKQKKGLCQIAYSSMMPTWQQVPNLQNVVVPAFEFEFDDINPFSAEQVKAEYLMKLQGCIVAIIRMYKLKVLQDLIKSAIVQSVVNSMKKTRAEDAEVK